MKAALITSLFTLVWIAALLSLSSQPVICTVPFASLYTTAAMEDIKLAVLNFRTEYRAWPAIKEEDKPHEVSGDMLRLLLGESINGLNPRKIDYIKPPMAKSGKGGLADNMKSPSLLDRWGHPYLVAVTSKPDGRIGNPDLRNTNEDIRKGALPTLDTLGKGVIVYSAGEDGIQNTGDDYVSWRHDRSPPPSSWREKLPTYASCGGCVAIVVSGIGWQLSKLLRFFCEGLMARGALESSASKRRRRLAEDEI